MPKFADGDDTSPTYDATQLFEMLEEADWEGDYEVMRSVQWNLQSLGWIVERMPNREEAEEELELDETADYKLMRLWDFVSVSEFSRDGLRDLLELPDFPSPAAIDEAGPLFYSFEVELFLRAAKETIRRGR